MHNHTLENWQHSHNFNPDKKGIEKKTLAVVAITVIMMVAEIIFGWLSHSMALLADGWHMGTHAFALGISLVAYIIARKQAKNNCFTFGTWKIEILGAYSSALILGFVAITMVYTSVNRLLHPLGILYDEAIIVAVIGLIVNVVCAFILSNKHTHTNTHYPTHENHNDKDLNLKSAYVHVIADALTSIFAIIALLGAKYFAFNWLDPLMGIVGAVLISRWAFMLIRSASSILLDYELNPPLSKEIKDIIEGDGDSKVCDLHLWKVSDEKYGCIISLVLSKKRDIGWYKKKLKVVHELAHVTIEINECGCNAK